MAVATLSCHAGVRKLHWWYPSCGTFILVSCLQYPTAPPKGQWVRKASPGWFWEIYKCSCLFTKQQHWATCAGSLFSNLRIPLVLSGPLYLKMILYWNKLVKCRNYCNDPRRNHKLKTWISDCFQLNTRSGFILRQLAFVRLIRVDVYHSVLLGTIKTACHPGKRPQESQSKYLHCLQPGFTAWQGQFRMLGFWRCWCGCAPRMSWELKTQQGQKVTGILCRCCWGQMAHSHPFPPHCCPVYTLKNNNRRTYIMNDICICDVYSTEPAPPT